MTPLFLIFFTGFAASAGQILVLRELLVFFYGNELSAGLVLACWLLWTAAGSGFTGRVFRNRRAGVKSLFAGLILLALSLPATLLWVRAARAVWSIPAGELISPVLMLAISFSTTGVFCFISGAMFALAWSALAADIGHERKSAALGVYVAESTGTAAGGLFYYFVLLPVFTTFSGSLLLSALLAGVGCAAAMWGRLSGKIRPVVFLLVTVLFAAGLLGYSERIDLASRKLQWGSGFIESRDTPYHNLAFLGRTDQVSLFCNGLWLYSVPDPQTDQPAAHLPLLQSAEPRKVLLIGDFSPGLLSEILDHPGVRRLDCVFPDPMMLEFALRRLPPRFTAEFSDPRVRFQCSDPRVFLKSADRDYSVVIMSAGEPVNAEMNRFYTEEFFSFIKNVLGQGGVFSFGVSTAPDIIGPREARLLKSLKKTLDSVFPSVMVISGEGARFFAGETGSITRDPEVLIRRMLERGLDIRYLRDYQLLDRLNPLRVAYVDAVLSGGPESEINKDFEPVCYLYGLGLWGAQLHPAIAGCMEFLSGEKQYRIPAGLLALILSTGLLLRKKSGPGAAVAFNTAICGAVLILLEIVLILVYQIISGAMYKQMALIISLFMAGLALGGAIGRKVPVSAGQPLRVVFFAQILLAFYALVLLIGLPALGGLSETGGIADLAFALLGLIAGMLGGGQFALAVRAGESFGTTHSAGSGLYAADLIGAAFGAVTGSIFVLPVFGIPRTLLIVSLAGIAGSVSLLWRGPQRRIDLSS